jgi:hypothetical protein
MSGADSGPENWSQIAMQVGQPDAHCGLLSARVEGLGGVAMILQGQRGIISRMEKLAQITSPMGFCCGFSSSVWG